MSQSNPTNKLGGWLNEESSDLMRSAVNTVEFEGDLIQCQIETYLIYLKADFHSVTFVVRTTIHDRLLWSQNFLQFPL